jgi:hypothetical protein
MMPWDQPPVASRPPSTGWWAEFYAAVTLAVSPVLRVGVPARTEVAVAPSLTMAGAERDAGQFNVAVTPALTVAGGTRTPAAVELAVTPAIGIGQNLIAAFAVDLSGQVGVGMAGAERYSRAFAVNTGSPFVVANGAEHYSQNVSLTVTPALAATAIPRAPGSISLQVTPSIGMAGVDRQVGTVNLAVTPSIGITGADRQPGAVSVAVTPSLAFTGSLTPVVGAISDDFTSEDTTKWFWGASASVSNRQLICPANNNYDGGIYDATPYRSIIGSSMSVECLQVPNIVSNHSTECYLEFSGGGGWLTVPNLRIGWSDGNFICEYSLGDGVSHNLLSTPFDPVAHRWWRLRESGGTVFWDTSPDYITWTNRATVATFAGLNARQIWVGSGVWATETDPTGTAIFAHFNVTVPGAAVNLAVTPSIGAAGAAGAPTIVPLAFDAVGAGVVVTSGTGGSWSHTIADSNPTTLTLVHITSMPTSTTVRAGYPTVTVGTANCFLVAEVIGNDTQSTGKAGAHYVYGCWGAPSGAQTVTVAGLPASTYMKARSISYKGVRGIAGGVKKGNISNPISSPYSTSIGSATGRITLGFYQAANNAGSVTVSSVSGTSRWLSSSPGTTGTGYACGEVAGAATATHSIAFNPGTGAWNSIIVLDLIPDGGTDSAVQLISSARGNRTTGSSTTLGTSWTHTVPKTPGNDYVLVGVVASVSTNNADTTFSVTYGGQAMTQLSLTLQGSTTSRMAVGIYYLADPPTGASTVQVTTGGAGTKTAVAGNSVQLSKVGTINTPVTATGSANFTQMTVTGATAVDQIFAVVGLSTTTWDASVGAGTSSVVVDAGLNSSYHAGSAVGGSGSWAMVGQKTGAVNGVGFDQSGSGSTTYQIVASRIQPA